MTTMLQRTVETRSIVRGLASMVFLALAVVPTAAQTPTAPASVAVFLDCRDGCDDDFIRTEITYVDWVRDRAVADVHVLITSQSTGADGSVYTFAFLGQRAFASRSDTLRYTSNATSTSDERRTGMTRTLAAGLMQYVARTPAAQLLRIQRARSGGNDEQARLTPQRDPWRAWVFEIDFSTSISGEKLDKNLEFDGGFEAQRVTEAWKTQLSFNGSYDEQRTTDQDLDDLGNVVSEETFVTFRRDWNAEGLLVKSLTGRWSAGLRSSLESNTFSNERRSFEFAPAIEANLYPYTESTRRQLVFQYALGVRAFQYADTTIFDKIRETLPVHSLSIDYATRQPWGSTNLSFEHLNYLSDASKRNTQIDASIDFRLFQGLSLNLEGSYSWVHDQLSLRKGGGDLVDVLLRRQELRTSYEYDLSFGFSYTFGSIFNNVVNPRF